MCVCEVVNQLRCRLTDPSDERERSYAHAGERVISYHLQMESMKVVVCAYIYSQQSPRRSPVLVQVHDDPRPTGPPLLAPLRHLPHPLRLAVMAEVRSVSVNRARLGWCRVMREG